MRFRNTSAIALAGVVAIGCGGGLTDPSKNVIDTFTATVPVGGSAFSAFDISRSGEYSVTLVSLSPPASVFVGVHFGALLAGTCSPIQSNQFATPGHTVLNGPIT